MFQFAVGCWIVVCGPFWLLVFFKATMAAELFAANVIFFNFYSANIHQSEMPITSLLALTAKVWLLKRNHKHSRFPTSCRGALTGHRQRHSQTPCLRAYACTVLAGSTDGRQTGRHCHHTMNHSPQIWATLGLRTRNSDHSWFFSSWCYFHDLHILTISLTPELTLHSKK